MMKIKKLLHGIRMRLCIVALFLSSCPGFVSAQINQNESILSRFENLTVDAKPMARMWFPDAGAGADDHDLIARQILSMAEGGFGGVEIALLADETTYTLEQARTVGWGTENWKNILKKVLRAANSVEGGFKVDITITAHWPPVINTIDPNDDEASKEIAYNYMKITQSDLDRGNMDIPLPDQKTTDSKRHTFYFTDKLVDAYVARVVATDSSGAPVLDLSSVVRLTDQVEKYGGMPAGIPDDEESEAAFGIRPDNGDFEGKINQQGLRKRMADWQYFYRTGLNEVAENIGRLNNDTLIVSGDWVLIGTFYRGTGQVLSGGGVITMYAGHYVTDYFSREGIQKVLDFWNDKLLSDPELLAMLKENGSKVGASIFEDSIEASHSGPFWTFDLPDEMSRDYAYADGLSLVVALSSSGEGRGFPGGMPGGGPPAGGGMDFPGMPEGGQGGGFGPGGPGGFGPGAATETVQKPKPVLNDAALAERIVQDYNLKLGELYATEHASVISRWASTFNYTYRAQGYSLTGLDIAGAAAALDVPEGDNATSGDGLRNLSSAVNMYGKKFLSMEAITTLKVAVPWITLAKELNGNFSHGVNRVILHGTPYAKTFDNNHTTWPGWGWGGMTVGVEQFTAWNQRQIFWEDVNIFSGYLARNQTVFQNGIAKVDLAVLNNTASSFSIQRGNSMQTLLDHGYSYNILSEAMLRSEHASVTDGRLYEEGPSYKALILNNATILSAEAIREIMAFTDAGLPVIIYQDPPSTVYGTETDDNNDILLQRLVGQLRSGDLVAEANSQEEIVRILEDFNVAPSAKYVITGLENSCFLDKTDQTRYFYLFNNSEASVNSMIRLEGAGVPYRLEAWTSEVIPLAMYESDQGYVSVPVELAARESMIIAIASYPDRSGFPAAGSRHVVSLSGGTVRYEGDEMVFQSEAPGSYSVSFSDGSSKTVRIDLPQEEMDLSGEGWDLTLYSFGPDDDPENLDSKNELIDPTLSRRTELMFEGIPLTTWDSLPASTEEIAGLGSVFHEVTGMKDVSGIGYYTRNFKLPEGWKKDYGMVLAFEHGEDMVTQVSINGHIFNKIDQFTNALDIGPYLEEGDNAIEIKLDTTSKNRISLEIGPPTRPNPQNSGNTSNGLTDVKLIPYMQVAL